MSSSPKFLEEALGDSWVDLSQSFLQPVQSQSRISSFPFVSGGSEYLKLLREAQWESNHSSARASKASSNRESLKGSPKSPPNSPNTESCVTEEELKGVYINYYNREGEALVKVVPSTDWIWDWSSRPDQFPPRAWKFVHPENKLLPEMEDVEETKTRYFSKHVLYTLIVTNLLSLLIGTGVGLWLSRRNLDLGFE